MPSLHPDAKIIQREGGPSELARKLGFDMNNRGAQRVHNWMKRGIPSDVKLKHLDIFMPELTDSEQNQPETPANQAPAAINQEAKGGNHAD